MIRHEGKKAVITGGTTGIGLAVARALLEHGADVLLTGLNPRNIDAARRELASAHVVRSDTASLADIDSLASLVRDKLGHIDLLFINAGFASLEPIPQVTEASYDRMFNINTKGAFFTAQRLAPLVRNGGSILFTTSIADEAGIGGMSVYSASKAAVRSFAQVFAAELLPRNIRVNSISPGYIKTPTMGVPEASREFIASFEQEGEQVTPMKRIGTPEEVASAVLFLAFEATFNTGIEYPIDGGLSSYLVPVHQ